MLSHELRTPLNAIVGWSRILRSGEVDPEDLTEGLDAIYRNANVQAQIIEDLLDVSRIISGKMRLEVQRINLVEVIDAAVAAVAPTAEARGSGSNACSTRSPGPSRGTLPGFSRSSGTSSPTP